MVARDDWDKSRVAVISGGGSGHEPAHAGFVGKGMLTAAVCGDLFASPSVDAVLNAIVAVTGDRGCLLIVKTTPATGLTLAAAEKAKRYGLKVEMVIVADDIALPDNKQPRGIAGTALVHKIAGYAAEQGKSLNDVRDIAQQACDNLWSRAWRCKRATCRAATMKRGGLSKAMSSWARHSRRARGFRGGYAKQQSHYRHAGDAVTRAGGEGRFAVLINNLGGVSALEMALLTKELAHSALKENIAYLIGPAPLVSALDMKGFSLTLLKLNDFFEKAIHAEVETLGWQKPVAFAPLRTVPHSALHDRVEYAPSDNTEVSEAVASVTKTLIQLENRLNALDAKVGDGDTGSTFAQGARDIAQRLEENNLPLNDAPTLLLLVGERLATVMGGSSGVLMSIFFTAAGQKLHDGQPLPEALLSGLAQMKQYGGADLGDRTLIDALQPALEALQKGNIQAAAQAAQQGAEATAKWRKPARDARRM